MSQASLYTRDIRDEFRNSYFKFELKFCSLLIISGGASFLQQSDAPVGQTRLTPWVNNRKDS